MKHFIFYITICSIIFTGISCQDDFMKNEFAIGKGKAMVSATLDFKPMSAGLMRTKSVGNASRELRVFMCCCMMKTNS